MDYDDRSTNAWDDWRILTSSSSSMRARVTVTLTREIIKEVRNSLTLRFPSFRVSVHFLVEILSGLTSAVALAGNYRQHIR